MHASSSRCALWICPDVPGSSDGRRKQSLFLLCREVEKFGPETNGTFFLKKVMVCVCALQ